MKPIYLVIIPLTVWAYTSHKKLGQLEQELTETDLESRGTYVSVWTQENGSWKWVPDSGNEGLGE